MKQMKRILFVVFFTTLSGTFLFSQNSETMLWTKARVKKEINKKISLRGEMNFRFGRDGLYTFFPQTGLFYKVSNWLTPSVEYRFLLDKNKSGNYKMAHRFHLNANIEQEINRLAMDLRLRYQYKLRNSKGTSTIRIKPSLGYNIKGIKLSPFVYSEVFFDVEKGEWEKVRYGVGGKYNLKGPNVLSFRYIYESRLDKIRVRHIWSLSFTHRL